MNTAPAVDVGLGDDPAARAALACLCAAAAASLLGWALAWMQAPAVAAAVGVAACAGALGGWRAARVRVRGGRLRWDGRTWSLLADGSSAPLDGTVDVALDLDGWMLLRFDGSDGRRRWWPLSRRRHASRWHALRCALFARRPEPQPLAGTRI